MCFFIMTIYVVVYIYQARSILIFFSLFHELFLIWFPIGVILPLTIQHSNYIHWTNMWLFRCHQGFYSLSGKASYRKISWSLEAARLDVMMIESLWNLTDISTALLLRYLSNSRTIGKVYTRISWLRDFTRSCGKTSVRRVNRGPRLVKCCCI